MSTQTDTDLSLFRLLTEAFSEQLTLIQATKATLVEISHSLEDLVIREQLPAMIFTGFQESSHWRAETARYRDLAKVAHQICIFAGGTLPIEQDQHQIHVRLRGPDPLRQEWFLLVLTERFSAVICGRDLLAPAISESDRRFDTIWSFEPQLIGAIGHLLIEVVARERPDRLADLHAAMERFPPVPPDAQMVTRFTAQLIDSLTRQNQSRLHLERVVANDSRLRTVGQVLSGVAHELNNPLQSILGFASIIAEEPGLDKLVSADAERIIEAAERAQSIVRSLLQLSRPAPSQLVLTNLVELIERTLIFVRSDLARNGIRIDLHTAPPIPTILANPTRIQQLVINLLTNAIQALVLVPPPREIVISIAGLENDMVELVIADNGPGIPRNLHEQIFEPFFTTKPIGEGTGLGLSIVQSIVQEHHGAISLVSDLNQGTRFVMRLPVANATEPMPRRTLAERPRGRVLVIDDDPQVNALITRTLMRAGYLVRSEQNALNALDQLRQERFDAIVCDLLMPHVSGTELYEQLVTANLRHARRLIFITGDATRPATQAFLEGSGRPYLLKPFTLKQLLEVVEQVVEQDKSGAV